MREKKIKISLVAVILILSLFLFSCGAGKADGAEQTPYDDAFLNELKEKAESINAAEGSDTEEEEKTRTEQGDDTVGENDGGGYLDFAPSADTENGDAGRSIPSAEKNGGMTVYITPTGKCYHFDADCGGKNSVPTTLDSAVSSGYRPCKKCADG